MAPGRSPAMLALAALVVLPLILVIGALVDTVFPKLGFNRSRETPFRPRLIHFMGLIFPLMGVGFFLVVSTSGNSPLEAAILMLYDVTFVLSVLGLGLGRRLPPFVWMARAFLLSILFVVLLAVSMLVHSLIILNN
jgi:hypothetical protein